MRKFWVLCNGMNVQNACIATSTTTSTNLTPLRLLAWSEISPASCKDGIQRCSQRTDRTGWQKSGYNPEHTQQRSNSSQPVVDNGCESVFVSRYAKRSGGQWFSRPPLCFKFLEMTAQRRTVHCPLPGASVGPAHAAVWLQLHVRGVHHAMLNLLVAARPTHTL